MSMFYRTFLDVFSAIVRVALCLVFAAAMGYAMYEFVRGK